MQVAPQQISDVCGGDEELSLQMTRDGVIQGLEPLKNKNTQQKINNVSLSMVSQESTLLMEYWFLMKRMSG